MARLIGVMSELGPFQPLAGDILGRLHVATPGIREGQASATLTDLRGVIDRPGKRQGTLKQGKRFFEVIFAHEQVAHGTARHGFEMFVPQTMSQVQRLLPVSDALALPAQAYRQQSGQLHQYVYAFWAGMILQPRERCFQGRLGRGVCLEPAPGAPQPMRGSRSAELVRAPLEPALGLLEGVDGLPLRPSPDGCLAQAQEQGSPLTLFCGKEFEGDTIVLQGIFRRRGLPCLLSSAASVVGSSYTVTALSEVEGQIGEALRTSLVSLSFQNATNEAMQAPSARGCDLSIEAFASFIVAEGEGAWRILPNEPCPYRGPQRLLDGLGFLTGHLGEEAYLEGASDQCSGAQGLYGRLW